MAKRWLERFPSPSETFIADGLPVQPSLEFNPRGAVCDCGFRRQPLPRNDLSYLTVPFNENAAPLIARLLEPLLQGNCITKNLGLCRSALFGEGF
jgi:hypothetical protein